MATVKEFVEFWLENSVHADEQLAARRGREDVERLVDNLVRAGEDQGFTKQQMEAELGGDLYAHIRASIDSQNKSEIKRRKEEN